MEFAYKDNIGWSALRQNKEYHNRYVNIAIIWADETNSIY